MDAGCKAEWLAERAFVALYIAAHRGHLKLCRQLVEVGEQETVLEAFLTR